MVESLSPERALTEPSRDGGAVDGAKPGRRRARGNALLALGAPLGLGGLLFASDQPLGWWWLQLVLFVPWWLVLRAYHEAGAAPWRFGALFALGYTGPTLAVVGTAPPILVVAAAAVLQWSLMASLAGRLLGRGPVRGALAAAAACTAVEVAFWYAVPMFGTAQCFARPWSAAPALVGFVAWTGVGGLVFAVLALPALVAAALRGPARTLPLALAAAGVAVIVGLDVLRWTRPLGATVRVATFGYTHFAPQRKELAAAFATAKGQGAQLLVTPETGIHVTAANDRVRAWLVGLVRQHTLAAAIGVWHDATNDNRIWFFAPDGTLCGEYRKTHLVPWLESYTAGDGTPVVVPFGDAQCGGLICQDDNFGDVARAYGRRAVPILAVPTNDWDAIRAFHLENSVFRAIEHGFAMVRAASNGISAIVSPRGEILQRMDHVAAGPGTLVGDVPLGDGAATWHARLGDWPIVAWCALLIGLAFLGASPARARVTGS